MNRTTSPINAAFSTSTSTSTSTPPRIRRCLRVAGLATLAVAGSALLPGGAAPAAADTLMTESSVYDAGDRSGRVYLAGFAGFGAAFDYDSEFRDATYEFEEDSSAFGGGAFGFHFTDRTRGELEVSFSDASLTYRDGSGLFDDIDADVSRLSVVFNMYRDIELAEDRLDWYIGGGLGVAVGDYSFDDDVNFVLLNPGADPSDGLDDSEIAERIRTDGGTSVTLQAQVLTGLAFHLTDSLTLTAGYRGTFFGSDDPDDLPVEEAFRHSGEVGLRWTF